MTAQTTQLADLRKKSKLPAKDAGGNTVAAFFNQNKATLQAVLPKHVSPDRMLKIAMGALRTTPKLMNCTVESLFGAIVQCSQLGLEPNTPMGHVYLIPFDKKAKQGNQWVVVRTDVQIIIGYKGMLDLARRSGQIVSIAAHEVCENDEFEYSYGLDEKLHHVPAMTDRGEIIAFYAVAKLKDQGHCFEVMSRAQVDEIRNTSQGYKTATQYKKTDTPWIANYPEMGRKTVTRRLFKWLPMSIEMATAAALDGVAEVGLDQGLDNVLTGEFTIEEPNDSQPEQQPAIEQEPNPEPQKPVKEKAKSNSKAFSQISKAIAVAASEADLEAVIALSDWSELIKGEAQKLQNLIAVKRDVLGSTAEAEKSNTSGSLE